MSLLNSLFSGVSGIRNHQSMMDNIGNNIANVNTLGYKSTRVTFSDTFNQFVRFGSDPTESNGGTSAFQIGLGMKVNSIDRNWNQGTFERTGLVTDLALQGDALFALESNGERFYSRAGAFTFDADGNLVNNQNGATVLGKNATTEGVIPPGNNLEKIQINKNEKIPAVATTEITWGGNLDSKSSKTASENYVQSGNIPNNAAVGDVIDNQQTVYNAYGEEYILTTYYTNTGADAWNLTWDVREKLEDGTPSATVESSSAAPLAVTFDANGVINSAPTEITNISFTDSDSNFKLDFSKITQESSSNTLSSLVDEGRDSTIVEGVLSVFDSLGNSHSLTLRFTKTADHNWNFRASVPSDSGALLNNTGTITFNEADGTIESFNPNPAIVEFQPSGATSQKIELDFGQNFKGITQLSQDPVVSPLSQNGSEAATLSDLNIDQYGNVVGVFSNGNSRKLAQILLAKFPNNSGLTSVGENMFTVGANAGTPIIGDPGDVTATTIQSGALEQSNVDLSEEFTKMIIAQRGFQANARVVTVSDQLLQEITNLVR